MTIRQHIEATRFLLVETTIDADVEPEVHDSDVMVIDECGHIVRSSQEIDDGGISIIIREQEAHLTWCVDEVRRPALERAHDVLTERQDVDFFVVNGIPLINRRQVDAMFSRLLD